MPHHPALNEGDLVAVFTLPEEKFVALEVPRARKLFQQHRLTTHLSPISINIKLRSLKAAFNTALRWKYITESPSVGQ